MDMIETVDLTRAFQGRPAVVQLNLRVPVGEIYGFLGPNGAGKTTTIRMLSGILRPTAGTARVAGHDVGTHPDRVRLAIGLLPESTGYYGWMTAVELLSFFAALHGARPAAARERIQRLLEWLGLADQQTARVATFSRGMRARLGLARALVHRPQVVILDEPTLGLDPLGQQDILALIEHVNRVEGTTIFLSSHALDHVAQLCSRVGILSEGRLVAQGTVGELARRLGLPSTLRLTVNDERRAREVAAALGFDTDVGGTEPSHLVVTPADGDAHADVLMAALVTSGVGIHEMVARTPSLEDVFLALVRRKHRPAA